MDCALKVVKVDLRMTHLLRQQRVIDFGCSTREWIRCRSGGRVAMNRRDVREIIELGEGSVGFLKRCVLKSVG